MIYNEVIELEFPCSSEFVSVPRKAIEGLAKRLGLSFQDTQDLKLAIGEACTNAIKFSDESKPSVRVFYRVTDGRLEIEVHNKGKAFDKSYCQNPVDRGELPEGGLGLYLINNVMDELNIECSCGENCVTMVKQLKQQPTPEDEK